MVLKEYNKKYSYYDDLLDFNHGNMTASAREQFVYM
jgi:hypothetical protein